MVSIDQVRPSVRRYNHIHHNSIPLYSPVPMCP
jgi:hypothetical protein